MSDMAVNRRDRGVNSATGHFGRQMQKERLAHGWSLHELARRIGIDVGHLSRIENGKRPPSRKLAIKCDELFPERRGWFTDWHDESRQWAEVPPAFRSWAEIEEEAQSLRVWMPGIVHGLIQTEDYAKAVLAVSPGVQPGMVNSRLTARMERQRRVLKRDDPPSLWFIVDAMSLYREVAHPALMAAQLDYLLEVAALPSVTMTVMPACVHPGNESGFIVSERAVYAEHAVGGYVFTDMQTVRDQEIRFDTLRGECYRVSESLALIERLGAIWKTGASPLTAAVTAGTA